jgi:hypothetical protein
MISELPATRTVRGKTLKSHWRIGRLRLPVSACVAVMVAVVPSCLPSPAARARVSEDAPSLPVLGVSDSSLKAFVREYISAMTIGDSTGIKALMDKTVLEGADESLRAKVASEMKDLSSLYRKLQFENGGRTLNLAYRFLPREQSCVLLREWGLERSGIPVMQARFSGTGEQNTVRIKFTDQITFTAREGVFGILWPRTVATHSRLERLSAALENVPWTELK